MKKLTVLFAAVVMAIASYAACNEYGWTSGEDMYWALVADYNAYAGSEVVTEYGASKFYEPTFGKPDVKVFFETEPYAAKWGWLFGYLCVKTGENYGTDSASAATTLGATASAMRSAVDNFFFDGNLNSGAWNKSADFDQCCGISDILAWQSYWGSSYCVKEVCNDYGWKNGEEMYWAFVADYNTYAGDSVVTEYGASKFYEPTYGKPDVKVFFETEPYAAKWGWLFGYLCIKTGENYGTDSASAATTLGSTASAMRSAVDNFFFDGNLNSGAWNKSADFDQCCGISDVLAWTPYWGQHWCTGSATATVAYDLGGGITNDYGWTKAEDMYWAFVDDYNAFAGSEVVTEFGPSKFYDPTYGKADVMAMMQDSVRWNWLRAYIIDQVAAQKSQTAADAETYLTGTASAARGAVDNFFNNGALNLGAWNQSFDGTTNGVAAYAKYVSYWKHAWDNPTEFPVDSVVVLNEPYKEGESFRGWFLNEQGAGDPITEATSAYNNLTLYAIFGAYVYNMSEVWAIYDTLTAGNKVALKTAGIVSYVNGGQFYIQDDFGGMLCYKSSNGLVAGDKVTVEGALQQYQGYPEIGDITKIEIKAQGQEIYVPTVVGADLALNMAGHMYTKVFVENMKLAAAVDKNLTFVDGKDTIIFYNKTILAADYTVGKRYAMYGVLASYNGAREFVGETSWISPIAGIPADTCHYDAIRVENEYVAGDSVDYSIKSDWLISQNMGNWKSNIYYTASQQSRGMVVKDGIIYLTWRRDNVCEIGSLKLLRYDAATGDRLDDLYLKDYIFQQPAADTTGTRCYTDEDGISHLNEDYEWNYAEFNDGAYIFGPNTDLQLDDAGNLLVANLPCEGHVYQIWKIDPATGDGEIVVYMGGTSGVSDFAARFPDDAAIRLDRFGVSGDVTKDAKIIAPSQNSNMVYEMDIVDGKWDGEGYHIICLNGDVAFSYTPRIDVVDDGEAFYVDGFAAYPELFDAEGELLESFSGVFDEEGEELRPECKALLYNQDGNAPGVGMGGVREFMCGGAYFFAMAGASYDDSYLQSTSLIYRFKDANRHFSEMKRAWEVSANGFGGEKNAQFNYEFQAVEKDDVTTELYIYVAENGLGKYTITASKLIEEPETGLENISLNNEGVRKAIINGRLYIIRDGKAFNAVGAIVK